MTSSFEIKVLLIHKELLIKVNKDYTVIAIKNEIGDRLNIDTDLLRLIYQGRLMMDQKSLKSYGIENDTTLHCAVSKSKKSHKLSKLEEQEEEERLMGFDRLIEMGFSPNEIQIMRNDFLSSRPDLHGQSNDVVLRFEEDFLNSNVSQEDVESAYQSDMEIERERGDYNHLFIGLMIGFFLGLFGFLFLFESYRHLNIKFRLDNFPEEEEKIFL